MITESFYEKADLEQWLKPDIHREDYRELTDKLWEPLVEKNLSFLVTDKLTNAPVGVALNFDAHDEPEVNIASKLEIVFEFLEHLEGPIRDNKLPLGKRKVLHSFMMATHPDLSYQENVEVIQFMENEVLNLAKTSGFAGIFTTNTNPLTQVIIIIISGRVLACLTISFHWFLSIAYSSNSQHPWLPNHSQHSPAIWSLVVPLSSCLQDSLRRYGSVQR